MKSPVLWYACAGVCGVLALSAAGMGTLGMYRVPVPTPVASASTTIDTAAATSTPTMPKTYPVQKVVDGDTIDIDLDGETTRLRLIGMDTPEVVDPRKVVQCFGKEASAQGHALLEGQRVRLEFDPVAGTYDKYGRMLAYVFRADGLFYNEYMIAHGYAHEYTYGGQHYIYRDNFRAAQKSAEQAQLGFWSPATCAGNTTKPASTAVPQG